MRITPPLACGIPHDISQFDEELSVVTTDLRKKCKHAGRIRFAPNDSSRKTSMQFVYSRKYNPNIKTARSHVSNGVINIIAKASGGEHTCIGRVELEVIDYTRVFKEGRYTMYNVCDDYQGDWPYIYSLLFDDSTGDVLAEVTQLGTFDFVTLIKNAYISEAAKPYEAHILYHAANINGAANLVSIWRHITTLTHTDLAKIGFAKISQSNLLFINTSSCFVPNLFYTPEI